MPWREQMEAAIEDIGGELLAGSGFEDETPEPDFSESAPVVDDLRRPRVP